MHIFSFSPRVQASKSLLITLRFIIGTFFVSTVATANGGSINIGKTPVLTATLPTNLTFQVEFSTNGTTWSSTGVLLAGTGNSATVRLDGFPTNGNYRLSAIGTSNIITPAISDSLHVSASFPGASEVRIESVNQLGTTNWTNQAFAFSNLQTAFVAPLRPSPTNNAFLRAAQPVTPLVLATLSSYLADTNNNRAGFGIVADDMPQLYRNGYIAAPCPSIYDRGGSNSVAAGECYELTGPYGKSTVIVADSGDFAPSGTCEIGRPYFDVGTAAFTNLFKTPDGYRIATYRLVPAPVSGNVKLVCVINSGGYYTELRPYNYRAGIIKLEVQAGTGPWTELPRTSYNSFVYNSGTPLTIFNTRVTSRFGEVVTFPTITSLNTNDRITANSQFNVFPDQGPSPVWIPPPVYTDVLTNVLGGAWGTASSDGTTLNPSFSGSVYQGNYSLRISNLGGFGTVNFFAPASFPSQPDAYLEFAIRSEGALITTLRMQLQGFDATGGAAASTSVALPSIDSSWRVFRIPLASAGSPAQINQLNLINTLSGTLPNIDLDCVAFRW